MLPKTFFIFTTYFVIPFLETDIKITQTIIFRPKGREDDLAFIRAKRIRISFLALQVDSGSLQSLSPAVNVRKSRLRLDGMSAVRTVFKTSV
jgi:hypothetical protein